MLKENFASCSPYPNTPENTKKLAVVFFWALGSTFDEEEHVSEGITTYPLVEKME